ncbi:acyl-CoA dehydrogenase [Streptomyces sp. NPDC008313]|uniref:acyl-CoA dehydrogenase family protein n=1 Tax=Streptomyces sp. NPDC008313 TaxID=3364826 RepID=UPI0036E7C684
MTVVTSEALRTEARDRNDPPPGSGTGHPVAAELTHLLFEGADRDRVHGTWRELVAGDAFAYRPGLSPAERTALSYDRLRLLNAAVDSPVDLAADPHRLAALHEWTGPVDGGLTTLASIHYNLFLGSLLDHDGDRRDLSPYTSLERTGTFLCTELDHGNDVASMRTVAVLDRRTGGFHLHTPDAGARKFMPNTGLAGGPKTALVAARLVVDGEDQGVYLFLSPLSDSGGDLPGVRVHALPERTGTPVDHSLTSFDHMWLPREAMLEAEHGRLGPDGTLTSTLGNKRKRLLRSIHRVTMGKLCMSAGTLGMSRAALTIAVRHAHTRLIAGPRAGERVPLAAHASHHSRLLGALATAYAMTFLHRTVVERFARRTEDDREEVERLAAIAKGWITWQARTITTECRERCGAQGLFPANGLSDLPQNIEGGITAEGDNLVIWVKAASEMVFAPRPARTGDGTPRPDEPAPRPHTRSPTPGQPLTHTRSPALGQSPTLGPDDRAAPGDLTDPGFLRDLLAEAETIWQTRARAALREGPSGDPLGRWNAASAPALEMVSAHACRQAADAFLTASERATTATARALLRSLCRLFLLHRLREHTGDLLAEGLLTPDQVRSLPRELATLTAGLAPHLPTLTDAFDVPPELLSRIPIASGGTIAGGPGDRSE